MFFDQPAIQQEITRIIANTQSSSQALRALYNFLKTQNVRYSLTWLAGRIGVASRGHISDIMSGRRPIRDPQIKALSVGLRLSLLATNILKVLVLLDREKDLKKRAALEDQLAGLRKTAFINRDALNAIKEVPTRLALDVFCAFWLFGKKPSWDELWNLFRKTRSERDLKRAIAFLEAAKMITADGTRWKILAQNFSFAADETKAFQLDLMHNAFDEATKGVKTWFGKSDVAYFETVSISVKKARYVELLRELRNEIQVWQTRLDADDADAIIRLNMQVYPVTD